jgi:excisionase family DNA binding protein
VPQDDTPLRQRLFSVHPAAFYLDMSEKALRALVFRRAIPVVRVGRRIFFDRLRLDEWIADHTDVTRRFRR